MNKNSVLVNDKEYQKKIPKYSFVGDLSIAFEEYKFISQPISLEFSNENKSNLVLNYNLVGLKFMVTDFYMFYLLSTNGIEVTTC